MSPGDDSHGAGTTSGLDRPPAASRVRSVSWILRVLVAAVLLAVVLGGETGRSLRVLLASTPWLPLLFTVQTLVGAVIESERLRLLLAASGLAVPRGRLLRVVIASAFFSACIPGGTGGDVMKFFYLDRDQVLGRARLAAVLLFDRAIGLVSLLVAALAGGLIALGVSSPPPAVRWLMTVAAAAAAAAALGLWFLWSRHRSIERWRAALVSRLPWNRVFRSFIETLTALRETPGSVLGAIALSTAGQLILGAAFLLAGRQLMPEQGGLVVGSLALLGLVANAIPITPGGLGVGEVAFNGIFRLAGAPGGARLVLLWRIGAIPVIVVGGLLYAFGLVGRRAGAGPVTAETLARGASR